MAAKLGAVPVAALSALVIASLVANPLSAWFAVMAAILQLIALFCIARLARGAAVVR